MGCPFAQFRLGASLILPYHRIRNERFPSDGKGDRRPLGTGDTGLRIGAASLQGFVSASGVSLRQVSASQRDSHSPRFVFASVVLSQTYCWPSRSKSAR
jgi:hypothetical protein